eukprot:TRINITY_DN18553_c0_g1_i1.p1 TRINITY_DN18553_c0_g1~~TRINITY_DN18553_c0_g1_i1.p1  ORF type:complete len:204 (+),score=23.92 TRINITY_DN18553_c0_g1_i1:136-747(+)
MKVMLDERDTNQTPLFIGSPLAHQPTYYCTSTAPPTTHAMLNNLQNTYIASCHKFGVKANSKLRDMLDRPPAELKVLDLSKNYMGFENGLACLLDVIQASTCLEEINLSGNYLTSENINSLVEVLITHPSVSIVRLNNNRLYIDSGKDLLRLVRHNRNVILLELTTPGIANDNKIPEKILNQIQRQLQINMTRKANTEAAAAG